MLYVRTSIWAMAAALALVATGLVTGQESTTVVAVGPEVRAIGERYFGGSLQIVADGQFCGELSFTDPAQRTTGGGAQFELGSEGQPEECERQGAELKFWSGNFVALANRYTVEPGARIELAWLYAWPLRDGLDEGPASDGRTYLTVDGELRAARGDLDSLDVFADEQFCGNLSLTEAAALTPGGGVEFELGADGQLPACGKEGAVISLRYPRGIRLSAVYRLALGQRIGIHNFSIPPPHTGDGSGEAAPGAPAAGAGLATESSRASLQSAVGVATFLLLAGVVLYVVSRRSTSR